MTAQQKALTIEDAIAVNRQQEKRQARLRKRTDEELISLALQCIADKEEAEYEYDVICQVLEERFPQEENEERLITPSGLATRTVTNQYCIAGKEEWEQAMNAGKMRELLGKDYDLCVSETTDYSIPKHLYPDLVKELGKKSGLYVRSGTKYTLTAKFRRMYSAGIVDFGDCVTHRRIRKITIEPVGA